MKFKLSKNIQVSEINTEDGDIPEQYLQDHYVLYDQLKDREFLINGTIRYFLDKFSNPRDELEILQEVQQELKSNSSELQATCSTFFKFLVSRRIIVPEDYVERDPVENALFSPGDHIGDFEILEVLSIRHYLDIYLVTDKATESTHVLKLLDRNKTHSESAFWQELQELEREFAMLEKVDSVRCISHASRFEKNEQFAYISLEFIKGRSLSSFLNSTPGLIDTDCYKIINDILEGFSQLHDLGLIHGDIHASNVLVTDEKEVRVIDLGMSRSVETEDNALVKFGGVDFYMPPERINTTSIKKHLKGPDLYSEVYQVGLLIYLVLYNSTPFYGYTWEELAKNIKESPVRFEETSFLNYPIPASIIEIVKRCLEKEPEKRYRSASEILECFRSHAFEEMTVAVN